MSYSSTIHGRRIKSGLGYINAHTVRGGLGDTACTGTGQSYRADVSVPSMGLKGQCLTDAQYAECKSTGKLFGVPCTIDSSSSGGGIADGIASVISSLFGGGAKPPMPTGPMVTPAPSGMSQSTMIALGVGAVGLVAILMLSRK